MLPLAVLLSLVVGALAVFLGWRVLSHRRSLPCPSWLGWMVDNRFSRSRTQRTLALLDLSPGMHVLDAGCGPGRLTIPIAQTVGPQGSVFALDIQPEMLSRAQAKATRASVSNVKFVLGSLGATAIPSSAFDRATLVTVLGEIPDRTAALKAIFASLRPGGFLLVSEVMGDPHYQSARTVRELAEQVGFRSARHDGNWLAYSLRLERPHRA